MRLPLPRTMTALVTGGCLLVSVPLLLALLFADMALQSTSRKAEAALQASLTLSMLGSDLRDNLNHLERNARQFVALGDPALLDLFANRLRDIDQTLLQLQAQPGLQVPVARLQQGLAEVARAWSTDLLGDASLSEVVRRIHSLSFETAPIIAEGRRLAQQQALQFHQEVRRVQRMMLYAVLALVPLTALLAIGFSIAVTRPLRRMAHGVAALGHARYDQPIAIGFPREMQRLAEKLDWLRQRLAALEEDKDRFLRHVSHELKTPLASLREGATLLREGSLGALSPQQREVAQILIESSTELEALIDNLLAYAEWRRERGHAEMEWFEARPLVEEVVAGHRLPLAQRDLQVEVHLHAARLFGQRAQLRTALDNLLTNAIKHSPRGTAIEIDTTIRAGCCELQVRDHGRGVPEHERDKIFEPFVRGSEVEESTIRGTGVGLSIVRETAQAHAGNVAVADAAPGARFSLQWPFPAAAQGAGQHAHGPAA